MRRTDEPTTVERPSVERRRVHVVRKPDRRRARSGEPLSEDEAHIGATEDQVAPTTPPSPNDDEPKQG